MALVLSRRLTSSSATRSLSAALLSSCGGHAPSFGGPASCNGALADERTVAGAAVAQPGCDIRVASFGWQRRLMSSSAVAQETTTNNDGSGSSNIVPGMVKRRGKMVPVDPGLAARLELLAGQCGVKDVKKLAQKVAALHDPRQQGMIDHGLAVEAYLHSLGIEQEQMAKLLQKCPNLFSRPVEARASVLFGQLMRLGMAATAAAESFNQQPFAADVPSFEPVIAVLSALLAADSKDGKPGEQLLGEVLTKQPAAVELLYNKAEGLQSTIDYLLKLGLTHQQLAAFMHSQGYTFLTRSPTHLADLETVLQQELGGDRQLWLKLLRKQPRAANTSVKVFRERVQALVAEFGRDGARKLVKQCTWAAGSADLYMAVQPGGRLLYLEQEGLRDWLVAEKRPARQEWRRQHGRRADKRAHGEPALISVGDVSKLSDVKFAGLVAAAATQLRGKLVSSNSIEAEVKAFQAGLKKKAAWQQLWAEAEELEQKLRGQLPPVLLAELDNADKDGEAKDIEGQLG